MSRPTELNDEVQKSICNYIRMGLNQDDAAVCSGISEATFYNWKKWGNENKEVIYIEFLEAVKKAKIESKAYSLEEIQKAAAGGQEIIEEKIIYGSDGNIKERIVTKKQTPRQWQPHAWRLERIWPDEFGRKDKHQIGGELKVESFLKELPPDVAEAVIKLSLGDSDEGPDQESSA